MYIKTPTAGHRRSPTHLALNNLLAVWPQREAEAEAAAKGHGRNHFPALQQKGKHIYEKCQREAEAGAAMKRLHSRN